MIKVPPLEEEFKNALNSPSEMRNIEFKSTLDLTDKFDKSKFAKHLCAICNTGGGWLIFGREDAGGFIKVIPPEFDHITTEIVNGISRDYLYPPPECTVKRFRPESLQTEFPVVWIPPLDRIPVMAIKNGPQDPSKDHKIIGVEKNGIYFRTTKPETVKIVEPLQFQMLLDNWFRNFTANVNPVLAMFSTDSLKVIKEFIQKYSVEEIEELIKKCKNPPNDPTPPPSPGQTDSSHRYSEKISARETALIALIGSWNENNEDDTRVFSQLLRLNYSDEWLPMASEILHKSDLPISVKNGIWTVTDNVSLLKQYGSGILDQSLDDFRNITETILCELDPMFSLPLDQRMAAQVYGKITKYSPQLRNGISQGLAIMGNFPELFENCSFNTIRDNPKLIVNKILDNSDWRLWGSLNHLLPNLAESSPNEFIDCVSSALMLDPCPFDEVFKQEGNEFAGGNHIVGLLWALEALAWDEKYLTKAIHLLANLAEHDPGGYWANRPSNSIVTILCPWLPQTLASTNKRFDVIRNLLREFPEVGWKSVLGLLPNQQGISTGTKKPTWLLSIPEDYKPKVTNIEYDSQIKTYSDIALENIGTSADRISDLIKIIDNLPDVAFENFIQKLSSDEIRKFPDEKRSVIWENLVKITNNHKQFHYTDWAFPKDKIAKLDDLSKKLAPDDPNIKHQMLFSDKDYELIDSRGNWEEQNEILENRREEAVREILDTKDIESVIQFSKEVVCSHKVGKTLGSIADQNIDNYLIPEFLLKEGDKNKYFIEYYVKQRYVSLGSPWVDSILNSTWDVKQFLQLLLFLPCKKETWIRVEHWLKENESMYWKEVTDMVHIPDADIVSAIDKFIQFERPRAAITCFNMLREKNMPIDNSKCFLVLENGVSSRESSSPYITHETIELIEYLQINPDVSKDELVKIEFAYLRLLNDFSGARPKALEHKLSTNPDFFCEMLKLVYKSKHENDEKQEEPQIDKDKVENVWHLLRNWKTVPGTNYEGEFDSSAFKKWIKSVKGLCSESGHLEIALDTIGSVLIYAPEETDGLWINRTIAEELNEKGNEVMREAFRVAKLNSRGVHVVDPSGKPEDELARSFREKVEALESAGFQNFANAIQRIVDSYEREAEENRDRWK